MNSKSDDQSILLNKDEATSDFQPSNFWEVLHDRPLDERELADVDARATAFIKLMKEEQLQQKRREFQLEIFKIDCELGDLANGILPYYDRKTLREKFESAMVSMKNKNQK
jgi:hypothetical protein